MIPKEQITYYSSVTFLDGAWRAYCYVESCHPCAYDSQTDLVKTFEHLSTHSAADALKLISLEIETWELENIIDL